MLLSAGFRYPQLKHFQVNIVQNNAAEPNRVARRKNQQAKPQTSELGFEKCIALSLRETPVDYNCFLLCCILNQQNSICRFPFRCLSWIWYELVLYLEFIHSFEFHADINDLAMENISDASTWLNCKITISTLFICERPVRIRSVLLTQTATVIETAWMRNKYFGWPLHHMRHSKYSVNYSRSYFRAVIPSWFAQFCPNGNPNSWKETSIIKSYA